MVVFAHIRVTPTPTTATPAASAERAICAARDRVKTQ